MTLINPLINRTRVSIEPLFLTYSIMAPITVTSFNVIKAIFIYHDGMVRFSSIVC